MYSMLPMFQRQGPAAYKKDLHNTLALCSELGDPHNKLKTIHIAGTNGKGSVSHFLASILQASGYRTGLYTSPHLLDFRERIKIDGIPIPEEEVIDFVEKMKPSIEKIQPSFFELTVAMAFDYFAREKVDVAVIETGLGGRLDSTNVITSLLSVITNISYDHMNMLGNTLSEIAGEKAGIIKPGVPVVIGGHHSETDSVFITKAKETKSPIIFGEDEFQFSDFGYAGGELYVSYKGKGNKPIALHTSLGGYYQLENLRTVLSAIPFIREEFSISQQDIESGVANVVANTGLRGRWEKLSDTPLTIADVAHNEAGLTSVISQVKTLTFNNLRIVFGMVRDKDASKVLTLLPKTSAYYFCCPDLPRGLPAIELRQKASEYGLTGRAFPSVKAAYEQAKKESGPEDLILITGSFFVVAEVIG